MSKEKYRTKMIQAAEELGKSMNQREIMALKIENSNLREEVQKLKTRLFDRPMIKQVIDLGATLEQNRALEKELGVMYNRIMKDL